MEAYDISNTSGVESVGSMVVYEDGKPKRSDYRKFKIACAANGQDDYASMRQVLTRRFVHYKAGDKGFDEKPDVLLIDGGIAHAGIAEEVLREQGLSIPVFGMVKDDRHRTRALVTPEGREIGIVTQQAVFTLIGRIQEETHRFAITYHHQRHTKSTMRSALDGIPGLGTKRQAELKRRLGTIRAIREADEETLVAILPKNTAHAVWLHFHEGNTAGTEHTASGDLSE